MRMPIYLKLALVLFVSAPALGHAEGAPIKVSSNAIGGQPQIKPSHSSAGDQWQLLWRRDAAERSLLLIFTRAKGNNRPKLALARDIHDKIFEEGLTKDADKADVRVNDSGSSDVWGGQAKWILGSELAERDPSFAPLGDLTGDAPRGPERRFCTSFVWTDGGKQATGGAYCMVLSPGQSPDGETMLRALELEIL
jgi:hypothetical protein